jgi:hypothetical protein
LRQVLGLTLLFFELAHRPHTQFNTPADAMDLSLLAYSPDLNPIENLWSIMATQVNMDQCATEDSRFKIQDCKIIVD